MNFKKLKAISREHFRVYTTWPFLIGVAVSWILRDIRTAGMFSQRWFPIFLLLIRYILYFMFPANLLIYWVNDIADGDTDAHNTKKWDYEEKTHKKHFLKIRNKIIRWNLLPHLWGIILLAILSTQWRTVSPWIILAFASFYLTSIFYSLPPVRAKATPFLDGIFNVLYAIPGIIGFLMMWWRVDAINWIVFIAWRLWCVAMHTYSAIPDIEPDTKAGIQTTATYLWEKSTLLYCLGIRWRSWLLLRSQIPSVMKVYKMFPRINGLLGFLLFWIITAQFLI